MIEEFSDIEFIKQHFYKNHISIEISVDDRKYWEGIKNVLYERIKEHEIDYDIYAPLLATDYMAYEREGKRTTYNDKYFNRRKALCIYALLEAMEDKGRYIDKIINLVWLILEEMTWCVPEHSIILSDSDMLPGTGGYALDLFAAETAAMLITVNSILKSRFEKISRNISPRITEEVRLRVCDNYIDNDFWWMAFDREKINNWNPWINSNVLLCVPEVYKNDEKAFEITSKIMKSLERYEMCQPEDGGCEEGPMYWEYGHASFIESLYLLNEYSDGDVNLLNNQKVKNMLEFFKRIYIGKDYVVNFADGHPRHCGNYGLIYKLAQKTGNCSMASFAENLFRQNGEITEIENHKTFRLLDIAQAESAFSCMQKKDIKWDNEYIESLQIATFHAVNGIFAAIKGGNNDENHNHNDVGNFILYKNNVPFIIDSGNMQYTKWTFSEKRYSIWTNMSEYHNLPKVNGINQHCGAEYAAECIERTNNTFSLDIANAYESFAGILKWKREFSIADAGVMVTEEYALNSEKEIALNFLCAVKPVVVDGEIIFENQNQKLVMEIATGMFAIETEEIDTWEDRILRQGWGRNIYRMKLCFKSKAGKITYMFK